MTNTSTPVWLLRLARLQVTYLLTALAVVGIFWAIAGRGPSLAATFIYSFVLGNLTALALDYVKIPYAWRQAPTSVFVYIGLLAIVGTDRSHNCHSHCVRRGSPGFAAARPAWKFPSVASAIYGAGYLAHVVNRNRLEDRSRELRLTIALGAAERELDAAELRQAREIQTDLLPKEIFICPNSKLPVFGNPPNWWAAITTT